MLVKMAPTTRSNLLRHSACFPALYLAALQRVMIDLLADHTELFKQFSDNPSFKKWLSDTIFVATYRQSAGQST